MNISRRCSPASPSTETRAETDRCPTLGSARVFFGVAQTGRAAQIPKWEKSFPKVTKVYRCVCDKGKEARCSDSCAHSLSHHDIHSTSIHSARGVSLLFS